MITVKYKGVDITSDISINQCYHDMYAEGQSDTLHIRFNDTENLWDTWQPQTGDEIAVEYGSITTGKMFVDSASPENGLYTIIATSVPPTAKEPKSKAWQKVGIIQIAEEIAGHHALSFKSYGVENILYDYILQTNESDFSFLNRVCALEGCAFLVFDGALVIYNQTYMESMETSKTIELSMDSDYLYQDNKARQYGSCLIEKGLYKGKFEANNGCTRQFIPNINFTISNQAEADRFAKNLLRNANKNALSGFIRGRVMPEYAAASTAKIENSRAPSWDGNIFLTHVRNDYAKGKSKIFFRKPLDGY